VIFATFFDRSYLCSGTHHVKKRTTKEGETDRETRQERKQGEKKEAWNRNMRQRHNMRTCPEERKLTRMPAPRVFPREPNSLLQANIKTDHRSQIAEREKRGGKRKIKDREKGGERERTGENKKTRGDIGQETHGREGKG